MRTLTVSKLVIVAVIMTLQLCLAQDVAQVADVSASNSSQEGSQAASTQVSPALAAAGTTAAEVLSQIPPLEGPIKLAVVVPLPPRYTATITAQGSRVVAASAAAATHDPAVRVESMQPTAVVADAVLERDAVPSTYQGILDKHNYYRAWHSAGPLSWSTALANSAASFASQCSQWHDPYLSMNEGENLWMIGGPGSLSFLTRAVDEWYAEVQNYDYNYPGFYDNTGHFTQLVWRATTQLGCAFQACSWGSLIVCRYSARGNVVNAGYFSSNVLPRQANPPQPSPPTPTPPGTQPPTPPSPSPKPPPPSGNPADGVVPENHFIRAGCLVAPAKRYWICLDDDANLVLYNSARKALWSNTNKASGIGPMRLVMHADGNLYIWDSTDAVMWSTNTAGRGVAPRRFQMQDDGNALIADAQNGYTWATYTAGQKKRL